MTRLDVLADLTVDVNGVPATLTGHGGRLVLASEDPGALWAALTRAGLPAGVGRVDAARALGRLADGLRAAGVRVEVRGPDGGLAVLGAGVDSVAGRLGTGSSALRPGGPGVLGRLLLADLRRRPLARAAAVTGLVAVALTVARRLR